MKMQCGSSDDGSLFGECDDDLQLRLHEEHWNSLRGNSTALDLGQSAIGVLLHVLPLSRARCQLFLYQLNRFWPRSGAHALQQLRAG